MLSTKSKEKKSKYRLPHTFLFPEGKMHQNQSIYAPDLLEQYLR